MNKLRVSSKKSEISTVLYQMYLENLQIKVWQNISNQRIIGNCSISHINLEKSVMKLELCNDTDLNFDDQIHIYIYGEAKSIVFKVSVVKKENELLLSFPEEVRLLEKREISRIEISHEYKEITIAACLASDATKSPRIFKFKLIDFSTSGVGIESIGKYNKYLYESDTLSFLFIDSKKLSTAINAKIRYIRIKADNSLRLGLQFEKELRKSEYDRFLQTISTAKKA